jgi:hypothetical protein
MAIDSASGNSALGRESLSLVTRIVHDGRKASNGVSATHYRHSPSLSTGAGSTLRGSISRHLRYFRYHRRRCFATVLCGDFLSPPNL